MNLILKSLLFPLLLLLTALPIQAEEDKWIDGIRFRPVNDSKLDMVVYMPWKIEDRISPYFSSPPKTGAISSNRISTTYGHEKTTLFPFALELPETLMTSWSYRGGQFDFEFPTEHDLRIEVNEEAYDGRLKSSYKTSLYNDFFNASDKAFADANSDWEMIITDVTSSRIFLGYTWGFFIPIGENHRWFKLGAGLGVYYIELSLKLNLCSQLRYQRECVGKKEIDSYSGNKFGVSSLYNITIWERRTKDSIWRFLQGSGGVALGSNDKGYIRVKLKNHRSLALWMKSSMEEFISYTYRF
tara:strand:+ start:61 stop:957 length:897 start_codon:yes stop_codon:yes gene_type:complete